MNPEQPAPFHTCNSVTEGTDYQIPKAKTGRSLIRIRNIAIALVIAFQSPLSFAQDFQKRFEEFSAAKDTAGQRTVLMEWEKKDPRNPELYVAGFNFFVQKSMQEFISLQKTRQGQDGLQLLDSTGKTAGYLNSNVGFDAYSLKRGIDYINQGITVFPDRLDMRFGKVYILGQSGNYYDFTREIIRVVEQSGINKNAWQWTGNKPVEHPREFMLSTVQKYVVQLYNTQNDSLFSNMVEIAAAVLKLYPDHVESLSNLSVVYLIREENQKALAILLRAEKTAPNDSVILNNIAETYKRLGNYPNAIKYYELVLNRGDEEAKTVARAQIETLKKKQEALQRRAPR